MQSVCFCVGIKQPGKPGCPVISSVNGREVTVDWTPPDSVGGSQITQYIVCYGSADQDVESFVKAKIAGRSKSCTFSKSLKFNCTCKFAVAAKNKSGIGPLSEYSACVKTPTRSGNDIFCFLVRHYPWIICSFY